MLVSTMDRSRAGAIPGAQMRTPSSTSRGPASTGSPSASAIPKSPRASDLLLADTSSAASSICSAAAAMAIRVAAQAARAARKSQPGVTSLPPPPSSAGISVTSRAPFSRLNTTRRPASQRAAAGVSLCNPNSGRRRKIAVTRSIAAAIVRRLTALFRQMCACGHFGRATAGCQASRHSRKSSRTRGQELRTIG